MLGPNGLTGHGGDKPRLIQETTKIVVRREVKSSILTPINTFCVLQRTTEQPQEKRFAWLWFVWVAPPVFKAGRSDFCIYISQNQSFSNIFRSRSTGGKLSKLTRGTSSCLSRRVVLVTRVIEIFFVRLWKKSLLWAVSKLGPNGLTGGD